MALIPSLQAGSQFGVCKFSQDSQFLFTCCGSVIKVFNTLNGECVHDLEGHTKQVTGVLLNPSNVLQIISCGLDGLLIYWDFLDGVILQKHDLHVSLHGILSVNAEKKSVLMLAQLSERKNTYGIVMWKKKKTGSGFQAPIVLINNCAPDFNLISHGCMKDCVAAGIDKDLAIHSMKTGTTQYLRDKDKFHRDRNVTCVACHPTQSCVAAGLDSGRILLWYNIFVEPTTSILHWHSLPVKCLSFTPDGSCMLSGGHECVMVRWQIGSQSNRDFKPRMGAPLQRIQSSPDGTLYAVNNSDNVIQLLDINLKVQHVYRGLTRCISSHTDPLRNPIPCGLHYDPRTRTIVTNGLPGHLQFYSLALNKQLYNLDIVGQNYISPETLDRPTVITEVTAAAVNHNGQWLATFETWDDGVFTPEMRLKFWTYSSEAQTYTLNTRVEYPHDQKIKSMLFHPPHPKGSESEHIPTLLTLGADKCFKVWMLVDDTDIYRENVRWDCEWIGLYQSMEVSCADFSSDGTILAVGFEHLMTLWDPYNAVICKTLSNKLTPKEPIRHIKFGSQQCKHMLVIATEKNLISWDLLTLTILWTIQDSASVLVKDLTSDLMAYVSSEKLCVFKPSSAKIVYKHDKTSSSQVLDGVFVPNGRSGSLVDVGWSGTSQIYLYNAEQQLITFDSPKQDEEDSSKKVKIAQNLPQSALRSYLAESVSRGAEETKVKDTMGRTSLAQDNFLTSLLQTNEPVSLYCGKFLNELVVKRKNIKRSLRNEENSSDSENESSSSNDETDEESSEPPAKKISKSSKPVQPPRKNSESDELPKKFIGSSTSYVQYLESETNMDELLSERVDWVQWCASLSLK